MKNDSPLVSVIVHTKNSKRTIKKHLESIKKQSYKNVEIIAVDNHSIDKTKQILREFTKHVYTYGPERSAQRNFGVKQSKGVFVYIPDSDMILDKNVILECVNMLKKNKEIKALIVPEKTTGKGFFAKCKSLERDCYIGDSSIEAARFFDKKTFLEFGGYDESLTGPEDWDLPQRIKRKYKIGRVKSFIVHDEGRVTLLSLARKKYYYAQKASKYFAKHPLSTTKTQAIYILRPAFYRNWKKLADAPLTAVGMFFMLSIEQVAGGLGFLKGKYFT